MHARMERHVRQDRMRCELPQVLINFIVENRGGNDHNVQPRECGVSGHNAIGEMSNTQEFD